MSKLFGDWNKFKRVLTNLKDNREQYEGVVISIADKIVERIWDIIEAQEPDFAPLVEEYRQRKIREGYDERIMIKTCDYLNSITVKDIQSNGDELFVFIGFEDKETETGIKMTELAEYLEYGTSKMPARYPITQSWEIMKNDIKKEVAGRLKAVIGDDLR